MNSGPGAGFPMFFLSQLGSSGPVLFVYLVAGYFAIMYMERARLPSLLTLIGVIILLVTFFGQSAANAYLIVNRKDTSYAQMIAIVTFVSSCLRAVGQSLLVAAIFVGRNKTAPADRYLRE